MRKVIIMFALAMGIITANAQENVTVETTNGSEQPTLTKEVYPQKEADGDLYHGLSRKLTFDRMIPPHGLEVTYDKTVHVIFPAEVRYVDLVLSETEYQEAREQYGNGFRVGMGAEAVQELLHAIDLDKDSAELQAELNDANNAFVPEQSAVIH